MKAYKNIFTIVFIISIVVLFSCKNDKKKATEKNDVILEIEDASLLENLTYYRFPSPEEIFEYIKLSGIDYNGGTVNPAYYHNKYMNTYSQTLNMGIYISDLAYITMFDQQEESLDYFEAIHYLSETIRISAAFRDPLLNRISENIDNIDSLIVIANDAYQDIVDYLIDNKMENKLALLSIGAFIETMYLTISYVDTYNPDNDIVKRIVDQKFALSNLYEYVIQYEKDDNVAKALPPIMELKQIFDNLSPEQVKKTKVETTNSNKLVLSGGTKYVMSEEQFNKLKKIVDSARKEFVKF